MVSEFGVSETCKTLKYSPVEEARHIHEFAGHVVGLPCHSIRVIVF